MVRIFERARDEARRQTPSFEGTWDAAERRAAASEAGPRSRRWWLSWRMGPLTVLAPTAAAAVLVLVALLVGRASVQPGLTPDEQRMAADLSAWSAPTDSLLADYSLGLPEGTPELGGSLDRLQREIEAATEDTRRTR